MTRRARWHDAGCFPVHLLPAGQTGERAGRGDFTGLELKCRFHLLRPSQHGSAGGVQQFGQRGKRTGADAGRVESVLGFRAQLSYVYLRLVEVSAQVVRESFTLLDAELTGGGELLTCQFHGVFPGITAFFLAFVKQFARQLDKTVIACYFRGPVCSGVVVIGGSHKTRLRPACLAS